MALPINIEDLINGKSIEWERLEFKEGWNPEDTIHTICAFANDINNWGGGYIIVGINESEGQAILPPKGLKKNQLDKIQGDVLTLSHQVSPNYYPIIQPYLLQEKHILVLWCPAGDYRPYTAPNSQGKKAQRFPYIRLGSRSIIAKNENLKRLHELAARIPFDDRMNRLASIQDFDLSVIQAFLHKVKSELYEESKHISLADLTRQMHIAKGADEDLHPINAGLLFFSSEAEKFFPRSWIELVWHKDFSAKNFSEKIFKGPIHYQLRAVLDYIKNNHIFEEVHKISGQAEAKRFYNYPFAAIEETISNAVYHKSYELGNPIEIQIWPDKIEVLSFPGPVPPVDAKILKNQKRIVARDYRNRRIGDFLKELGLTEGRGTGFPAIYRAIENNQSPAPIFETNETNTYFLSTLIAKEIRKSKSASNLANNLANEFEMSTLDDVFVFLNQKNKLASNPASNPASNLASNPASKLAKIIVLTKFGDNVISVLNFIIKKSQTKGDIFKYIKLSDQSKNRKTHIDPLLKAKLIEFTIPEKPTHQNQKYKLTELGFKLITFLNKEK